MKTELLVPFLLLVSSCALFAPADSQVRLSEVHELLEGVADRTVEWDPTAQPTADQALLDIIPTGKMPRTRFAAQVEPLLDAHDALAPTRAEPIYLNLYLGETNALRAVAGTL